MTSSLRKKRQITRQSIRRWTWASLAFSLALVGGLAAPARAFDTPATLKSSGKSVPAKSSPSKTLPLKPKVAKSGKAKLSGSPSAGVTLSRRYVVRAQNDPEAQNDSDSGRVNLSQIPPAPNPVASERESETDFENQAGFSNEASDANDADIEQVGSEDALTDEEALQRLKQRSARQRWEQLHQEWLQHKKQKAMPMPPEPDSEDEPMSSSRVDAPADSAGETEENPFEEPVNQVTPPSEMKTAQESDLNTEAGEPASPESDVPEVTQTPAETAPRAAPGAAPRTASPRTTPRPRTSVTRNTELVSPDAESGAEPSGRVRLQKRQKPAADKPLTAQEELNRLLEGEAIVPIPAPVTDPDLLPKISAIDPNPKPRTDSTSRPRPEELKDLYVELGKVPYVQRISPEMYYSWEATNSFYYPLYFEDPDLERYGHTRRPIGQLASSIGRFTVQLAFMPYQMTLAPLHKRVYPLGYYNPGDYVPYQKKQIPWNWKAAGVQAGTVLGIGALTP